MNILVISKDKSILTVKWKREEVTLLVDNSTLINWYPFNSLYHYRMDKDNKEILKLKRGRGYGNVSYRLADTNSDLNNYPQWQVNTNNWVCPTVQKDNEQMIKDAKEWGLPVITEPFDYEMVERGMLKLGDRLSELSNSVIDYYLSDKSALERWEFKMKDRDNQVRYALRGLGNEVDEKYCMIGQIYVMLKLMKKIARFDKKRVTKNEIRGLFNQ